MDSLLKVVKAFKKNAEYLPIPYPELPMLKKPSRSFTKDDFQRHREAFDAYEANFYATVSELDSRFENGMTRIKTCALLYGFLNPFTHQIPITKRKHYKWCPHDAWMEHSRPKLFLEPDSSHQFS